MRFIPVLTALCVVVGLYLIIFERDAVLSFARAGGADPVAEMAQDPAENDIEPEAGSEEAGVSVIALKSTARQIDSAVVLRGRTESSRHVDLQAETSGLVVSDPLRKGAEVEAGTVMCRLAPGTRAASLAEAQARLAEAQASLPQNKARVAEAEARVAEAEINLNAASKLSEGGFASETRVASSTAALESARAALVAAKAGATSSAAAIQSAEAGVAAAMREIERLEITAPFGGLLETDAAETGSLLQPGALCATIVQIDPIRLVGFVPEVDVDKIQLGARAGGRLVNGTDLVGHVTFLSRAADPVTRTFRVEIEVPNTDLAVRDGQTVDILISTSGRTAHLLPQSALTLDDDGNLGVRLVGEDGTAQFAPVDMIRDSREGVWVAGLDDVANVIVVGQDYVSNGVALNVTWQEPDA